MVGQLDYLLKMVTAARCEGLGDLVWRSYDAFKKKEASDAGLAMRPGWLRFLRAGGKVSSTSSPIRPSSAWASISTEC